MMKYPMAQRTWTVLTWVWLISIVAIFLVGYVFDEYEDYYVYYVSNDLAEVLAALASLVLASQVPRAISYILTGQFKYFPDYRDQV